MLTYGYIVSNLARNERYIEAENLLDRLLKNYEKDSSDFEEDGSRIQRYSHEDVDGTHEVILKKNVTDGHIAVYSNRPIKILRFAIPLFYVRDIIPTAIFAFLYLYFGLKFNRYFIWTEESDKMFFAIVAGSVVPMLLNFATEGFLKNNRSYERIRFIQAGGIFCFGYIFFIMLKTTGIGTIWSFWINVLYKSPIIECAGGLALTRFINKYFRGK